MNTPSPEQRRETVLQTLAYVGYTIQRGAIVSPNCQEGFRSGVTQYCITPTKKAVRDQ